MRIVLTISCMLVLAACSVKQNPAKTGVYTPYGGVEYHCPPGQAKKGRC